MRYFRKPADHDYAKVLRVILGRIVIPKFATQCAVLGGLRTAKDLAKTIEIMEKNSVYILPPLEQEKGQVSTRRFLKGYLWLAADCFQRSVRRFKLRPKLPGVFLLKGFAC